MSVKRTLNNIKETGIVAIMRGFSVSDAAAAAKSLYEAGIRVIEVACNSSEAVNTIKCLREMFGNDVSIGAGTVLDVDAAKKVIAAGAEFVLAPDCNPDVIKFVKDSERVMIPGAFTATEILCAVRAGADIVKVFPASIAGPEYIKELRGPLVDIAYMPVGGVTVNNTSEYIRAGSCAVGVGANLLKKEYLDRGNYTAVRKLAEEYIKRIKYARGEGVI